MNVGVDLFGVVLLVCVCVGVTCVADSGVGTYSLMALVVFLVCVDATCMVEPSRVDTFASTDSKCLTNSRRIAGVYALMSSSTDVALLILSTVFLADLFWRCRLLASAFLAILADERFKFFRGICGGPSVSLTFEVVSDVDLVEIQYRV